MALSNRVAGCHCEYGNKDLYLVKVVSFVELLVSEEGESLESASVELFERSDGE